ncbi:MAG: hypothetical protein J2P40_14535 [Candidatus Dormibacteraeota bacterium]|nr:hypothetical protein [Candidatus Dormibacteraeota bacterium]MBO0762490.1 hypothetical protein [Candidatus Dormibacteraeota bacterium]
MDERLSVAVADLRWKLHDVDALRWRRNLIARGAAPLIAMPHGYEHIAQVLNSKRRLDERIADVICGVAKPLLGLVGAAAVGGLLATTPLLSPRLVQGFELPRSPVEVLVVVPEQEARWLGPPATAGAPVMAAGAGRVAPAATTFARPVNPLSEEGRGRIWSAHILGTPRPRAEQRPTPGQGSPQAQPAPTPGTAGTAHTPATGTTPSTRERTTPSASPPAPGATQPSPGTQPSSAATPAQGTPTPGTGTSSSTGGSTATSPTPATSGSPASTSGSPGNGTPSTAGTPTSSTTPTAGSTGSSGAGSTPAPTASGTTSTP